MKKIALSAVALVTLFMMATPSSGEVRITPDEIGNAGFWDPATLFLSAARFSTSEFSSDAAVICASNASPTSNYSYAGLFVADGEVARAVCGRATRSTMSTNYGGYFVAWGGSGRGVYAEASGNSGRGVYAEASGTSGIGVYGRASNKEGTYNFGGYFQADGQLGRGVYAITSGANSTGVYAQGKSWDFFAGGDGGNYGPFTGAHEVKLAEEMSRDIAPGMVVSATGKTEIRRDDEGDISLSSTLPTVTLSETARDKAVLGVLVAEAPHPQEHWYAASEGERFGVVNALGEGRVWVTDRSGEIEAGDYITTSYIPGYGQRQADDLLHSYTLGKAIETIDWGQVTDTVQHEGKTYRRYLLAVVYTSG